MANKMLIDAAHPEETRVVVVRGKRVEEFDYESASKKQLRGNIYLAKVTRVEPSLQAAFVDYGGNRHGFLAFNEIHPDYYQIPMADRLLLKEEEAREAEAERAREAAEELKAAQAAANPNNDELVEYVSESAGMEYLAAKKVSKELKPEDKEGEAEAGSEEQPQGTKDGEPHNKGEAEAETDGKAKAEKQPETNEGEAGETDDAQLPPDTVGAEDALEEIPSRPRRRRRKVYKIQEVIRRGQIILIQVVKEERGNKGAALTTYLSLAGRYTVLMPNTARGGGISRKINNIKDRKRLREIADNIEVPEGTGLIVRTAGASRTKAEIKRDFDYLLRLWENIRKYTLSSSAPKLIYEEGNLIKRSIRDLYSKEIDEVLVAGDHAYREAKDFMRLIMPSHAKNVHHYKDADPLFMHYQVERQLNAMFNPEVKLKSGGYIVINQTEALVAVDVNSGKSTREFSIEETALNTNLEAAAEVARQLRLRDLAGLIVIDFIDMDERRNNRAVEQMMKNCLKSDRARIQVGHISSFGLLEMSRQRLRTGVVEGSTSECPNCLGTGIVRSTESVALYVLRSVEDMLMNDGKSNICATTTPESALYILNSKRGYLRKIEAHFGVFVNIAANPALHGANFTIEKLSTPLPMQAKATSSAKAVSIDWAYQNDDEDDDASEDEDTAAEGRTEQPRDEDGRRKRSRRPRRRKPRADAAANENVSETGEETPQTAEAEGEEKDSKSRRPRRRGRRGGRNRDNGARDARNAQGPESAQGPEEINILEPDDEQATEKSEPPKDPASEPQPATGFGDDGQNSEDVSETDAAPANDEASPEEATPETKSADSTDAPESGPETAPENDVGDSEKAEPQASEPEAPIEEKAAEIDPDAPKKRGWWQRRSG